MFWRLCLQCVPEVTKPNRMGPESKIGGNDKNPARARRARAQCSWDHNFSCRVGLCSGAVPASAQGWRVWAPLLSPLWQAGGWEGEAWVTSLQLTQPAEVLGEKGVKTPWEKQIMLLRFPYYLFSSYLSKKQVGGKGIISVLWVGGRGHAAGQLSLLWHVLGPQICAYAVAGNR